MALREIHLDTETCERARQARDPRFDGRFFVCVKTTGIYCRPVCRVRIPMAKNVTFHMSAGAAEAAGFRPCLRCRPETAPATPAWNGTSTTVAKALRYIEFGFLDEGTIEELGDRLGVGARHLSRLFAEQIGASPKSLAETRRLHLAKRLLDQTTLPMAEVALASGYGSIRRFNDAFRRTYERTPRALRKTRKQKRGASRSANQIVLALRYRPPFDWDSIINFLGDRVIPGVEDVTDGIYRRSFSLNARPGTMEARHIPAENVVSVTLQGVQPSDLPLAIRKCRRIFDLDADPLSISADLCSDPDLATLIRELPGQRIPGAFDAFEVSVRAVLGQQVSVKSARAVAARLVRDHGAELPRDMATANISKMFPTPQAFLLLSAGDFGLPRARARTILALSQAVEDRSLILECGGDSADLQRQLTDLPGIGPWTASYIALRVFDDPDAFPESDLALLRVAEDLWGYKRAAELRARAETWRPWRAYAALHLWRQYPEIVERKTQK